MFLLQRLQGFDDYLESLTPENNKRNPWFKEYWETFFGCSLYGHLNQTPVCSSKRRISRHEGYQQDTKVQFVVDSVYAFAYALHDLQRDVCKGSKGYCDRMKRYDSGDFYRNYILKASFINIVGSRVKFDERGDGPSRYTIYNFRKMDEPFDDHYNYTAVGLWDGALHLASEDVLFSSEDSTSVCSSPCKLGEIKITQEVGAVVFC